MDMRLSISSRFARIAALLPLFLPGSFSNLPAQRLKDTLRIAAVEVVKEPPRITFTQSYSATSISEAVMEEKIATSLIDVLEQVPGITKRGEYHSPIALRGLGGKRLLITKDGNRRMGNFSGGFMGQGVNIYELAKVEVIKGPASVKYGPGAITGIINMESKKPFLKPGWHGRAQASYGANNSELSGLGSIARASLDHAFSVSARYRKATDFYYGKHVQAQNSEFTDRDVRAAYAWEGNSSIMVDAEAEAHLGGPWGRPLGFNGTKYMRMYNQHDNSWHSSATIRWTPEQRIDRMELSAYYDREYRRQIKDSYDVGSGLLSYREDVRYNSYYGGWRTMSVWKPRTGWEVSAGTDGVYYRIESPTEYADYFLSATVSNRVSKDAGVFLSGIFAESEYKSPDDKLKIRLGLRTDYSRINEGEVHDTARLTGRQSSVLAWNGTSGVVYQVAPGLFASAQVARSCRMPDASEMFVITSGSDGVIHGNPRLDPEYGLNLDAGLRGLWGIATFDLSLFCNFLHSFISLEYWQNSGHKGVNYTYLNIDKSRILGAELSLSARWADLFGARNRIIYNGAFVYTRGDKLTGTSGWFSVGVPLRTIPPFNFNQELTFRRIISSSQSFYAGVDVRYYTAQTRIAPSGDGGYVSPSYCLLGASAGYVLRKSLKWDVKLKADNLADSQYRPFETIIYGMGRNFKLLLTVDF
ncbi:MAG: TonB-dependent receptor [Prevotellaceae bacterium]|jgi:outer membrane receptor protein involved in Fe transport|nr:TonB-dependent receptor [Prevotellaceae bacterium]